MLRDRKEERTGFQESAPYHPDYDLQTSSTGLTKRCRNVFGNDKGYVVHLMTGVAWGNYTSYLDGEVYGETHWDEAQTDRHGR